MREYWENHEDTLDNIDILGDCTSQDDEEQETQEAEEEDCS